MLTFKLNEGYLIFRAKMQTLAGQQHAEEGPQQATPLPDSFAIYFKQPKNATQSQYQEITTENFEEQSCSRIRWTSPVLGCDIKFFLNQINQS